MSDDSAEREQLYQAWVRRYRNNRVGFVQTNLLDRANEIDGGNRKLEIWQFNALNYLDKGGTRLSIRSGHGVGKAHPLSLVVPTPAGYRRWRDIKPGDQLFAPEGPAVTVRSRHDQIEARDIYRVTFDDGSSTLVDLDHLWAVRGRQERRRNIASWRTLSTRQILEAGVKRSNGVAMARQWEIPLHAPAPYPDKQLPIPPYVLGAWLGDGTASSGGITNPDTEIWERIEAEGFELGVLNDNSTCRTQTVLGLQPKLSALGLTRNKAAGLPPAYLTAGFAQRRDLLQGLLDTDGWVDGSGQTLACFGSIYEQLAEDVLELVRSLGLKARMQQVKETFYTTRDGERIPCSDFHKVSITANGQVPLFSLPRKADALQVAEQARYHTRWIDDIAYSHQEEAMCVTVPGGLYLVNDFIVTHNSSVLSWMLLHFPLTRSPSKAVCTAPSAPQLEDALWAETMRWYRVLPPVLQDLLGTTSDRIFLKSAPDETFISARTSRAEKPEALQGIHSDHVLLIGDEASGIPESIFESASGSMSTPGAITVLTSNPTRRSGYFYKTQTEWADQWETMKVACFDSSLVDPAYIEQMRDSYGEDSAAYHVRVLGEFPPQEADTFIPYYVADEAMKRDIQVPYDALAIWGLDVARGGANESVLAKRRGSRIFPLMAWKGLDATRLVAKVKLEWDITPHEQRPKAICVDSIGVGGPVYDRMKEIGLPAVPVAVTDATALGSNFHRLRDELWGNVRSALESAAFQLPNDPLLRTQLTTPTYKFDAKNRYVIERKEDMLKRGMQSPDRADAVCLCFAREYTASAGLSRMGSTYNINDLIDNSWAQTPGIRSAHGNVSLAK